MLGARATYLRVSDEAWRSFGAAPRANGREIRVEAWRKVLVSYGLPIEPRAFDSVGLDYLDNLPHNGHSRRRLQLTNLGAVI